jgi:hypothetical protein
VQWARALVPWAGPQDRVPLLHGLRHIGLVSSVGHQVTCNNLLQSLALG